jgi:pimeloyl-ACP methyl ester carboxylesterase
VSAIADHHRGGEGPPLLLIHGFTATWRAWGPVIGLLEQQFDVFAPTLPGHTGGPEASNERPFTAMAAGLEAMLDELGWEREHVAGFSLGGHLALELAKRGRAVDVTAIAPGGAYGDDMEREWKRVFRLFNRSHGAAVRFARLSARLVKYPAARRAFMRDMMVDGSRLTEDEIRGMTEAFAATPIFHDYLSDNVKDDRELRDLDRVDVPVTIAWGDQDRTLRQAKHEAFFRQQLPQARFLTLKKAGHVPFWDATERVADVIAQTALATERSRVQIA